MQNYEVIKTSCGTQQDGSQFRQKSWMLHWIDVWLETDYLRSLRVSPHKKLINYKGKNNYALEKSGRQCPKVMSMPRPSLWNTHIKTHEKWRGQQALCLLESHLSGYCLWIETYSKPLPPRPRSLTNADPDACFHCEARTCVYVSVCGGYVLLKRLEERISGHFHTSTMQTSVPPFNTLFLSIKKSLRSQS